MSIKKLKEENRQEILDFVKKEKEINLFIIGDIENYGTEAEFLDFYGEYKDDVLTSVLMRFYHSYIVYGNDDFDGRNFSKIIIKEKPDIISGESKSINKLSEYINFKEIRNTYFAALNDGSCLYKGPAIGKIEETKISDVEKIYILQKEKISEFKNTMPLDTIKKKYEDKTGRGFHIKNSRGDIVSSAETTAENENSAMVVGVCTHPDYRGLGYAAAAVSKLCDSLLKEGKSLCLFYDNPSAGRIYKRLGFRDIGTWNMCKL